jgi:small ligand-binding sensory domain FIST
MSGFRAAHAAGPWRAALDSCLAALGPPRGTGGLGFLYVTDHLAGALPAIVEALTRHTGTTDWVGTVGLGVAGQDGEGTPVEHFDEPALAVMLADLPAGAWRLIDRIEGTPAPFATAAGAWLAAARPTLGLVHGDPRNARVATVVADLAAATGAYLVGGLTASRAGLPQIAGTFSEGGVSGVLFAESVAVATGLSQGCTPIGPEHRVTDADRTIVKAIDGRPAIEALQADIGDGPERGEALLVALPVAGSDTADYLVRNLGGVDPARGWIAIGATIEAGQPIRFVRRNRAAAVADLERMVDRLARQTGGGAIKGGVYVSCVARGPHLFGPDAAELKLIRARLGNFPLVGFFANGEICRGRLYTHTGVLTLFL